MSIQAVAWALEQDLPARPKLVLVSLANHANHTDGYCWLHADTIAGEAACTSRSVYKYVGGLVRNGYIRKAARKGDDGKQRANDYWLLLAREPAKWDWGAGLAEEHEGEDEPAEEVVANEPGDEAAPTISCEPSEPISYGENEQKVPGVPTAEHEFSHGPTESAFSRKSLAEPSNTKPKESLRPNFSGPPRGYRPPPQPAPQPLGAAVDQSKQIFVFEGTRAWDAWVLERKRRTGLPGHPCTTTVIDGKHCTGWWFASLFPPKSEPIEPSLATEKERKEFADTG